MTTKELFDRVIAAYAAEGFPHEIIGQWTLPANDVEDLVTTVRSLMPSRILEVGTFVGLSTMLIALAGGPRTRVVSIDPNFPLRMEMSSMGSALGHVDADARTQDVAARVADRLGVADRIDFIAGGFSVGATFSSRRLDPSLAVPVVGDAICERFGPFDFAFIDGLHYVDVVASDLTLAARHLTPNGVVLMHDCVGMWGTNVRAGISRFLSDAPDWSFLHPPLKELYRSIGTVFRPTSRPDLAERLLARPSTSTSFGAIAFAAAVIDKLQPTCAIELHSGGPRLAAAFANLLPTETLDLDERRPNALPQLLADGGSCPLVVSAGGLDVVDDHRFAVILADIAAAGACAAFLRTPPGESGAACRFSRPLRTWIALAREARLSLYQLPALSDAASRFLFTANSATLSDNSALSSHVIAAPIGSDDLASRLVGLGSIDYGDPDEIEQRNVLDVHYGMAFRSLFEDLKALRQQVLASDAKVQELRADIALLAEPSAEVFVQSREVGLGESAISHNRSRGGARVSLIYANKVPMGGVLKLLSVSDVAAICLPPSMEREVRVIDDTRIVSYSNRDDWRLPSDCSVAYLVGPVTSLTKNMLAVAWRSGIIDFRVFVAGRWLSIAMRSLFRIHVAKRAVDNAIGKGRDRARNGFRQSHLLRTLLKPLAPSLMTMEESFRSIVTSSPPTSAFVPKRVVHVCGNLAPGGAEKQAANTVIALARLGIDVHLLAHDLSSGSRRCDFHLMRVREGGVPTREIERKACGATDPLVPKAIRRVASSLPESLWRDIANIAEELRKEQPEIVHAWLDWDNVRAGLAAVLAGVPKIVLSGRNLAPYHFKLHQQYMLPAYRALVHLPQVMLINNSRAGADSYADWIGIPRERVTVIHNGFDREDYSLPARESRESLRGEAGFSADDILIGGVFRFEDEKRPLLWIEAAALIARSLPHARFVLYGHGTLLGQMKELAAKLGVAERLVFAGLTDKPLMAMSLMDILLLSSHGEGLPNVLIEAQAVGTAVVTTLAGGAAEAIEPGVTGWLAECPTPEGIADVVTAFAHDRAALELARAAGPSFVERTFGISRMIRETINLYGLELPLWDDR